MKYKLVDSELWHAANPDTFYIPPIEIRRNLQVGFYAKLNFENGNTTGCVGERMWVEVTQVIAGSYIGILRNEPLGDLGLHYGDVVTFEAKHVIDATTAERQADMQMEQVAKRANARKEAP